MSLVSRKQRVKESKMVKVYKKAWTLRRKNINLKEIVTGHIDIHTDIQACEMNSSWSKLIFGIFSSAD